MDHLLWERILVTFVLVFFANGVLNADAGNATYPALFAFGDSILDTGNNNFLGTFTKCNFPPYGRDFGEYTGRFSNGKVPTDLIAEGLGIKPAVPAYLSDDLSVDDLVTGVSFASGGSGNDNLTANNLFVLTLSDQLQNFEAYIQQLNAYVGPQKAAFIVSNGLYLFSAGNNDIALTYTLNFSTTMTNFPDYTVSLLGRSSNFLNSLYQLGARHVWVLSTLPLGCLPGPRTVKGGFFRACSDEINGNAQFFNTKLKEEVSTLKNQPNLPNFHVRFIDVYNPLMKLIQNPSSQGFTNIVDGCCGITRKIETAVLCNLFTGSCEDTSEYLFFDSAHPTQRAYELIVDDILKENNIPKVFG